MIARAPDSRLEVLEVLSREELGAFVAQLQELRGHLLKTLGETCALLDAIDQHCRDATYPHGVPHLGP